MAAAKPAQTPASKAGKPKGPNTVNLSGELKKDEFGNTVREIKLPNGLIIRNIVGE